jgi:YqaJ-like viral recombinase domain
MAKVIAAARKPERVRKPTKKPPSPPPPTREEQINKILAFVKKHGAIRQGTPAWRKLLAEKIGASESSAVLLMNKYMSRSQLIEKKRNPNEPSVQSVPCSFGKLFEPVARAYAEIEFGTTVYGHDLCIVNGRRRCSPDGLGVVSRVVKGGGIKHDVVVFEFKCPYIRYPDGKVPEQYKPQVWTGIADTAEIGTAYGIYVDFVFRKCSSDQLDWTPDHDRQYHSRGRPSYCKPKAYGVMNVYSNEEEDDDSDKPLVDYGAADGDVFDEMLVDVDSGKLSTSLLYLAFEDRDKMDVLGPQGHVEGMHLVGEIPFKLMKVCHKKVIPVENFGARLDAEVEKFFDDVNKKK